MLKWACGLTIGRPLSSQLPAKARKSAWSYHRLKKAPPFWGKLKFNCRYLH